MYLGGKAINNRKISSRDLGFIIEEEACKYLRRNQYRILYRNFFSRYGEIDIIAMHAATLVFVEVRYRKPGSLVTAAESIDSRKIRRLKLAIRDFLFRYSEIANQCNSIRVDLCAVSTSISKQTIGDNGIEPKPLEFEIIKGIFEF